MRVKYMYKGKCCFMKLCFNNVCVYQVMFQNIFLTVSFLVRWYSRKSWALRQETLASNIKLIVLLCGKRVEQRV